MKGLIYILLFSSLLISCNSLKKATSDSKSEHTERMDYDLLLTDDNYVKELTDRIIERIIKEHLNITIKQTKYDTNQPMVEDTGKHPVSEETDIAIHRETEVNETDSIHQQKDSISSINTKDQSKVVVKDKVKVKEKKENGLTVWQKMLIGLSVVLLLSLFIIIRIKKL